AATTASTISLPTYAAPAGSRPAATVRIANAIVRPRLVVQTSSSARRLYRQTPRGLGPASARGAAPSPSGASASLRGACTSFFVWLHIRTDKGSPWKRLSHPEAH